jgi:hypothetical protein
MKKIAMILAVPLLLTACATGNQGRSENSKSAENFKSSKICKGKIGNQTGFDVILKLAQGDPAAFACNATHHYALSLAKSYRALGRLEEEKRAMRFIESLENGTGDPNSITVLAVTNASTDQKVKEQEDIAQQAFKERKIALIQAQQERNKAILNIAGGGLAFANGMHLAIQSYKNSKDDDYLTKIAAIAKGFEMAQLWPVLPAIADTDSKFNENMKHLDSILNVEKVDASELKKIKPN